MDSFESVLLRAFFMVGPLALESASAVRPGCAILVEVLDSMSDLRNK